MDIDEYLNRMEHLLAEARPVPLSSSVMVHRKDFDELLDDLRAHLPEELRQSRWVIKERDEVLAAAGREAEQVRADARREAERLVGEEEVVLAAQREAERVLEEAREQARVLRLEAEDYVDGKLANFEIVLERTLRTVVRGRERLRGRLAGEELLDGEELGDRGARDPEYDADGSTQFYDHEA